MEDLVPIRRALLSVSDKTGLVPFATELARTYHVELLSTGGTAALLREVGLPVTDVSAVTGFPEMMDGRVKTLHPKVHGGLLALRDNAEHVAAMNEHGIQPIDLVCVNLYPFEKTVAKPDVTFEEAIENIDIGGPSMLRSAAKNHGFVVVATEPADLNAILFEMKQTDGKTTGVFRRRLAERAFAHTANYDAAITRYFRGASPTTPKPAAAAAHAAGEASNTPDRLAVELVRVQSLRYGENPHQPAGLYVDARSRSMGPNVARAEQLHGKELSYINLLDADAALACVAEFTTPTACIVKHATPCGVGTGADLAAAFASAYASDRLAAFGGIVAMNRTVSLATAQQIVEGQKFLEVIVAPAYAGDAIELIKARWKNVRILLASAGDNEAPAPTDGSPWGNPAAGSLTMHKIVGGYLMQRRDNLGLEESQWKTASTRPPTDAERADLRVAWLACKHVKSNAIVIAKGGATVGIGGGQVDRVNAARVAAEKAGERARGAVAASDAFFPFPDGPEILLNAGVTAIVHPGGSVRDQETVNLCNARGAALILTGRRHFRH